MNLRATARLLSAENLAASIRAQAQTARTLGELARIAVEREGQARETLRILESEQYRRATWKRVRGMRHTKGKS